MLKAHYEFQKKHGIMHTGEINTAERQQFRSDVTDQVYGKGAALKHKQLFLLIAPPGSGKSTLAKEIAKTQGAMILDGDDIREKIPEYQKILLDSVVRGERRQIYFQVLKKVIQNGDNLVLSRTTESVRDLALMEVLKEMKQEGFQLHLTFADASMKTVMARTLKRLKETGRMGSVIFHSQDLSEHARQVYQALKQANIFDSYLWQNIDAPGYQPPKLIEQEFTSSPSDFNPAELEKALPKVVA
jgi:predicted kinase